MCSSMQQAINLLFTNLNSIIAILNCSRKLRISNFISEFSFRNVPADGIMRPPVNSFLNYYMQVIIITWGGGGWTIDIT